MSLIPREFYLRDDVVGISRDLLGKFLISRIDGNITSGIICETEAYAGVADKASHAYGGRRTARTEVMYAQGGTAYIYLCYGIHSLFNIVTHQKDFPHAVLIRSIKPVEGFEIMLRRVGKTRINQNFGIGPGNVSKIMGIHYHYTGHDLTKKPERSDRFGIWLEDRGVMADPKKIITGPRIGVIYAGQDALLPYRFQIAF